MKTKLKIIEYSNKMLEDRLTIGTGGNISIKTRENFVYITPSGIPYERLKPEDISVLDLKGNLINGKKPSSETDLHLALYEKREDISSVIHCHSLYATVLACMKMELPPIHYLVAFSGNKVPVADYAPFGTKALTDKTVLAMKNYNAVLMANHGLLTSGMNVEHAYSVALNIEFACNVYVKILSAGDPVILNNGRIMDVKTRLDNYLAPFLTSPTFSEDK